jgi:hypothetical protein
MTSCPLFQTQQNTVRSPDSSVGTNDKLRMDDRGSIPGRGNRFV